MTDTRKQIIEIISDYMDKTLSDGCYFWYEVWKGYTRLVKYSKKNFRDNSIKVFYGRNINPIKIQEKQVREIIGHYDITAVLKYIESKTKISEIDVELGAKKRVGLSGNMNNIIIDTTSAEGEYLGIILPNKPLHLYSEQEDKDLLKLLLQLCTMKK